MGNRASRARDETVIAATAEHSESSETEDADALEAVVPAQAAPSLVWSTLNTVSASIKNFAPRAYVREGMSMALSSVTTTRLRRKTLVGAELELATFVCQTAPVDFTQVLSTEMVLHIARFLDGEDLLALERTCTCLNGAMSDAQLWQSMLEAKRRQITFVPFISESQRVVGCRNWEAKHRYFKVTHATVLAFARHAHSLHSRACGTRRTTWRRRCWWQSTRHWAGSCICWRAPTAVCCSRAGPWTCPSLATATL